MRRLRGTALDPFGRAEVRRVERALIGEYRGDGRRGAGAAHAGRPRHGARAAELPDVVRGYEEIKLRNVARFRKRAEPLRKRLDRA